MTLSAELKKRIVTALLGVGVMLLVLFTLGRFGAAIVAAVISLGMVWEFATLTFALSDRFEKRWVLVGLTWLVAFCNFWIPRGEFVLFIVSFMGLSLYFLFTAGRHSADVAPTGPAALSEPFADHFRELMFAVFGLLYLGFLPLFLPLIREESNGLVWTLLFLFLIWATDVGAYFAGRRFGKRRLYAVISPKKTWEGAWGGVALGVVVTLTFKFAFFRTLSWSATLVLPILMGWVSQLGDLCESFFKRAFHTKDSGSILPGHGGFLDRFDGVIFALPVMYACTRLFGS